MRVIIDMDGTIVATVQRFLEVHPDPPSYDSLTQYDITQFFPDSGNALALMEQDGFFASCQPLPGAVNAVNLLTENGCDVVICTHLGRTLLRSPNGFKEKVEWVEKHLGISKDNIVFTARKDLIVGNVFVDDCEENVDAWKKVNPDGRGIVFPQPWNSGGHVDFASVWESLALSIIIMNDHSQKYVEYESKVKMSGGDNG